MSDLKPSQPDHLAISTHDEYRSVGHDEKGEGFYGHLEARPDGVVVFVKDDERPAGG